MKNFILFFLFLLFSFSVNAQTYNSSCKCDDETIVQQTIYTLQDTDTFIFKSLDIINNTKVLIFDIYRNNYLLPYQVQVIVKYQSKYILNESNRRFNLYGIKYYVGNVITNSYIIVNNKVVSKVDSRYFSYMVDVIYYSHLKLN